MPLDQGLHFDVPEHVYHADPAPEPSLSHSIARVLLDRSPRHAWFAHPRLNKAQEDEAEDATTAMEEGSILHSVLLKTPAEIVEVSANNWRGSAGDDRRAARARGALPVLSRRLDELHECAAAAREQLAHHVDAAHALTAGRPEVTCIWQEGDAWLRARPDWLPDDPRAIVWDLKTTGKSAAPSEWERTLEKDYATQAAFYTRGLTRVRGHAPRGFGFIVLETKAPYGLCVFQPAPSLVEAASADVEEAIRLWGACMSTGKWPGYPNRTCHVEASNWRITKSEDRRLSREIYDELNQRDMDPGMAPQAPRAFSEYVP